MIGCTDAIAAAVRREIEQRRSLLDAATDLGQVTIQVRLHAGTTSIRGVVWEEERIYRRLAPRAKEAHDVLRA